MPHKSSEARREYQRLYRERNRDKILKWGREQYIRSGKERRQRYIKAHPERKRGQDRRGGIRRREKRRTRLFEILGAKCVRCGYDSDWRALQVDHVNGGGTRERNASVSLDKYYQDIIQSGGKGCQILCANCNQIKRYENGEERGE